jgi:DNA repair protein REV1
MSQQHDSQLSEAKSSSFPLSSPSFWNEAIQVDIPHPSKRSLDDQADTDTFPPSSSPPLKRARQSSPTTALSYLPKRDELLTLDPLNPHSYLSNAEYAPNKFGDIGDYMRKKEIKVQTQNRDIALASATSGIPQIFIGLSFYINGNTRPPMEELRKMILQRGGEVRPVLRSKGMVKYIIAPMLTLSKFKEFARYKVVTEGWITESCKEGKLLDWSRWKLQVQGGWEQEGRKGMEGFFRGGTQVEVDTKDDVKPDEGNIGDIVKQDHMAVNTPVIAMRTTGELFGLEEGNLSQPFPPSTPVNQIIGAIPQDVFGPVTPVLPISSQRSNKGTRHAATTLAGTPTTPNATPVRLASAATGSLLRPARPMATMTPALKNESPLPPQPVHRTKDTLIPLVPSPPQAAPELTEKPETPAANNPVAEKVERYEGLWEFYHSKESNEDAARLLKDKEWRLKNTAERGNEGGFIDGYYQNSR